jgi:hypothetical protein
MVAARLATTTCTGLATCRQRARRLRPCSAVHAAATRAAGGATGSRRRLMRRARALRPVDGQRPADAERAPARAELVEPGTDALERLGRQGARAAHPGALRFGGEALGAAQLVEVLAGQTLAAPAQLAVRPRVEAAERAQVAARGELAEDAELDPVLALDRVRRAGIRTLNRVRPLCEARAWFRRASKIVSPRRGVRPLCGPRGTGRIRRRAGGPRSGPARAAPG